MYAIRSYYAALTKPDSVGVEFVGETAVSSQTVSTVGNNPLFLTDADSLVQAALTLPEEYNRFEPQAELKENTELGTISFSTKIDNDYQAVDPTNIFAVGSYTVYATFSYDRITSYNVCYTKLLRPNFQRILPGTKTIFWIVIDIARAILTIFPNFITTVYHFPIMTPNPCPRHAIGHSVIREGCINSVRTRNNFV